MDPEYDWAIAVKQQPGLKQQSFTITELCTLPYHFQDMPNLLSRYAVKYLFFYWHVVVL